MIDMMCSYSPDILSYVHRVAHFLFWRWSHQFVLCVWGWVSLRCRLIPILHLHSNQDSPKTPCVTQYGVTQGGKNFISMLGLPSAGDRRMPYLPWFVPGILIIFLALISTLGFPSTGLRRMLHLPWFLILAHALVLRGLLACVCFR